jgi:hypothetical protein
MKSLTLHAMDDQLAGQLKRRADELSTSMNELAKQLLAEALGLKAPAAGRHRDKFQSFCGKWSKSDLAKFDKHTADLRTVDREDWQ